MGIVYAVMGNSWEEGIGDYPDDYEEHLDSIWTRKEDAKIRIDDLANEYIRQEWYDMQGYLDPDGFYVDQSWNDDRTSVTCNRHGVGVEVSYYIDEIKLNTAEEFTGP